MALRVLLITNEYPPDKTAGTAMSTHFLAEHLSERGHDVTVVVNERRMAPSHEQHNNVTVVRLRPLPLRLTRMAQRAAALSAIARRLRPQIIQGQSISCGTLALAAGSLARIPTITYVQGLDMYDAGPWARRTYVRWTLRQSRAVVTVTEDLRALVEGLAGRPATVIPHGLRRRDTHLLSRAAARQSVGLPLETPLILYVGRLTPVKGVRYLLRALPSVFTRLPEARVVLVGDGEEGRSLREAARDLGITDRVTFAGPQAHADVIRFMRAADVLVLPSIKEAFGMVLVEAMSCGLPVIASAVMGIPHVVEDGVHGRLVPPADPARLASAVIDLLADRHARADMAVRNVRRAEKFELGHVAAQFERLWTSLVDGA